LEHHKEALRGGNSVAFFVRVVGILGVKALEKTLLCVRSPFFGLPPRECGALVMIGGLCSLEDKKGV